MALTFHMSDDTYIVYSEDDGVTFINDYHDVRFHLTKDEWEELKDSIIYHYENVVNSSS